MESSKPAIPSVRVLLVQGLAFVLLVLSFGAFYVFLTSESSSAGAVLIAGVMLLIAAVWFTIYGSLVDVRLEALFAFPAAVEAAASKTQSLRREFNKVVTSAEGIQLAVGNEAARIESLLGELRRLNDLVASAEARLGDEIGARRVAETQLQSWQDRVAEVVRSAERLVGADGIDPLYESGAEKVLQSITRQLGPVGLQVIRPEPGDPYDEMLHQAVGEELSPGIMPGTVARVISWGLVAGDQRERAEVMIASANPAVPPAG